MNKIRHYISTLTLTKGFFLALLGSLFIYLQHYGYAYALLTTLLGLSSLYFLLQSKKSSLWFWYGAFSAIFWFWWVGLSFIHYQMPWAIPFVLLAIGLLYGALFWSIATFSNQLPSYFTALLIKALGLLLLSYIHPFGFDWFKPELMFVQSYLGIEKWQFALVLLSLIFTLWKKQLSYLLLLVFASQPLFNSLAPNTTHRLENIQLISTHISVKDKWNEHLHTTQFQALFKTIDKAIKQKKRLIVLPESVFPIFLNHSEKIVNILQSKAKKITIVTGGLYWDGTTPRNSTYIFTTDGKVTVANKVVLVPFGEANPLPNFLSHWVNEIFYDGAVDYKADLRVTDYTIEGITYRNAICFEATSERLYEKDKEGNYPKNMIVLSNNGWFTPSIEPTLQKLLLQYYSKKYGTTIYHSTNMSPSYVIQNGITQKD